jgi:hypothetical protein
MTRDELIAEVKKEFGGVARPKMFIRGTCKCDECLEHETEMQSFSPDNLPLDKLNNIGWDPICFASNEAFAYFMPGLVELLLDHTDEYVQQFIFHVNSSERIAFLSEQQRHALIQVLDFLILNRVKELNNNLDPDEIYQVKKKLNI